jgi:hypothetical protein
VSVGDKPKRKRKPAGPTCGSCGHQIVDGEPTMGLTNVYGAKSHVLYFHETYRGCQEAESRRGQRWARGDTIDD